MLDVADGDESHGTDGKAIVAGNAGTHPRVGRQVFEKRNGRQADATEFFNVIGPGNLVGVRACCRDLLVIVRQWRGESTSEPQRAKSKRPFRVGHVVESLTDAPLSGSVAVSRFVF